MNGIHEFVIRGGQTVTAGQMDAFRRKLPFLKVKAEMLDVPELPHLKPQTNFLARYAEDVLDGVLSLFGSSRRLLRPFSR